MPTIQSQYLGELRTEAVHVKSGTLIQTDAPVDNQGKGELFSPSDLVAGAFTSCMMTIMGILAERVAISITGTTADTVKVMSPDLPRRIVRLEVTFRMKTERELTDAEKSKFEKAAHTCPVALSLHPDIEQAVVFNW
ncbi:OsmC family protein [Ravibacter arvi]|uniref:OsmC family protein n=1 Tax=Ravibacter arvi TaxID=2051041 RepID=A0ABP8LQP2_9BACT